MQLAQRSAAWHVLSAAHEKSSAPCSAAARAPAHRVNVALVLRQRYSHRRKHKVEVLPRKTWARQSKPGVRGCATARSAWRRRERAHEGACDRPRERERAHRHDGAHDKRCAERVAVSRRNDARRQRQAPACERHAARQVHATGRHAARACCSNGGAAQARAQRTAHKSAVRGTNASPAAASCAPTPRPRRRALHPRLRRAPPPGGRRPVAGAAQAAASAPRGTTAKRSGFRRGRPGRSHAGARRVWRAGTRADSVRRHEEARALAGSRAAPTAQTSVTDSSQARPSLGAVRAVSLSRLRSPADDVPG